MAKEEKMDLELASIIEMINRYCITHKNKVCFVASFVAFKEVSKHKCPDCGEACDHEVSDDASRVLAYGDKETLRELLNELRDVIEDYEDEDDNKDGFVNI